MKVRKWFKRNWLPLLLLMNALLIAEISTDKRTVAFIGAAFYVTILATKDKRWRVILPISGFLACLWPLAYSIAQELICPFCLFNYAGLALMVTIELMTFSDIRLWKRFGYTTTLLVAAGALFGLMTFNHEIKLRAQASNPDYYASAKACPCTGSGGLK